jgi:hypothetical protein
MPHLILYFLKFPSLDEQISEVTLPKWPSANASVSHTNAKDFDHAIEEDETQICALLKEVLTTKKSILKALDKSEAERFIHMLQRVWSSFTYLTHGWFEGVTHQENMAWADDVNIRTIARDRIVKLSVQFELLPDGLMIQKGLDWGTSQRHIADGGFGMVYRAEYHEGTVALKRLKKSGIRYVNAQKVYFFLWIIVVILIYSMFSRTSVERFCCGKTLNIQASFHF